MSTRATYEIGDYFFYVHTDGYPSGAASYFADMIGAMTVPAADGGIDAIDDRRGGAPFAFIRGVMRAETTESHQAHGDTEHRWRIDHDGIRLTVQHSARPDFEHWTTWSAPAPLADFINRHYPGAVVSILSPDAHWKREILATTRNAVAIAARHRAHIAELREGNPNIPRHEQHAQAWESEILNQIPARVRWLEKEKAEAAAELAKNPTWGRAYYERCLADATEELEIIRAPIATELEAIRAELETEEPN